MQIRVGYELIYECPQPTPMILTLNVHYSRASDLVVPDYLTTDPSLPISAYRDGFGNWCSRIVAPAGRIRIASTAIVRDTGQPDPVAPEAWQHMVQTLPEETLVFLLGSRYCETDRLSQIAWRPLRPCAARLGARSGDLRLRPFPHRLRLRARPPDAHGLGSLQRAPGRLPRLRAPRHRALPLHEHSGALLHRLSRRHRHAAALRADGFRRLVRGLSRRAGGTPSIRATTCRASGAS